MKKGLTLLFILFLSVSIIASSFIFAQGYNVEESPNSVVMNNPMYTQNEIGNGSEMPPVPNSSLNQTFHGPQNEHGSEISNEMPTEAENNAAFSSDFSNDLECRINFNIGVLNSTMAAYPNFSSSLQIELTKLQNDLSQLQSLNGTNASDIQDFERGQYANDMRSVIGSVNSWRSQEGEKMPLDVRAALVSNYKQLVVNYSQCQKQAYTNMTQERVNGYQSQIKNFQEKINDLQERGFNVTVLNQLLSDAQTQIIQPLQSALSNANDSQQVQNAIRTYCLYDGCINGTNFHLDAKFDLTRATIILNDLQTNSAAFNLDNATVSQAQQDLTDAQTALNNVGTSAYQQGQSQTIFNDIQNASKIIVQLITQALKQPMGGLK